MVMVTAFAVMSGGREIKRRFSFVGTELAPSNEMNDSGHCGVDRIESRLGLSMSDSSIASGWFGRL